jgi:hypothetical protein
LVVVCGRKYVDRGSADQSECPESNIENCACLWSLRIRGR